MNEGEKTITFDAKPSKNAEKRKLTFQVAKVNKMLASVAGFCDADSEVIFRKHGGIIRGLSSGDITPFRRHGNIYLMDAYIPNPDHPDNMEIDEDEGKSGNFRRPEAR